MKRTQLGIILVLALAAAMATSGCKDNRTRVSAILSAPEKFVDREVLLGGEVAQSYAMNLLIAEAGAYQVDDGTGKIWVITRNGVPASGSQVGVKGRVTGGLKLGREVFGTVITELDRRVK